MKSINKGEKKISPQANNALAFTQDIISQKGPRLAGDKSTHKTAEILHDKMTEFCDSVKKQSFGVHPLAFLDHN